MGADAFVSELRQALGDELEVVLASSSELPLENAVGAYPFNSQVLTLADGSMVIVAPEDAREDAPARRFLERVVQEGGRVKAVHYRDVRQSMHNGGGPACLRLRVGLRPEEEARIKANVFCSDALVDTLAAWVEKHYRDRLVVADLADPLLARETMTALDELTKILGLGSVYDFQLG